MLPNCSALALRDIGMRPDAEGGGDGDEWSLFVDRVKELAEQVSAQEGDVNELAEEGATHLLGDWTATHPTLPRAGEAVDGLYKEIISIVVKTARAMESGVIVKWRSDFPRLQQMMKRWGKNKRQ